MSKNVVREGPDKDLMHRIEALEKQMIQSKSNQPSTIYISELFAVGATVVPAGTKQTFFIDLFSDNPTDRLSSMFEWSIYNGTVDAANDYDNGFGGLNRANYTILDHYSYGEGDGFGNTFILIFMNNSGSSVTIQVQGVFRSQAASA